MNTRDFLRRYGSHLKPTLMSDAEKYSEEILERSLELFEENGKLRRQLANAVQETFMIKKILKNMEQELADAYAALAESRPPVH